MSGAAELPFSNRRRSVLIRRDSLRLSVGRRCNGRPFLWRWTALAPSLIAAAVLLTGVQALAADKSESAMRWEKGDLPRHETRPVLPSGQLRGQAAVTYRIAKQIPEVLDQLYCYCRCKENLGHKSLLACYVDEHASHCEVCMTEALMAYDMTLKGKTPAEIQKAIDDRYKGRPKPAEHAYPKEKK